MERKRSAIVVADVAGYSRLMEAYETDTYTRLTSLRSEIIDPTIAEHGGRIVKHTGDGFLATFPIVNEALSWAIGVQQEIRCREAPEAEDRRIAFRMGLNVGDVIVEDQDVYGNGVNIAARLEELTEPGGLTISAAVRDEGTELKAETVDLGNLALKNLENPVRAFRVLTTAESGRPRQWPFPSRGLASIALPFRTLHPDPAEAYLGDGMVENIVGALASLEEMLVISRNSTLIYRSVDVDIHRAGQELGVRYILSGSVRRSPQRIRIMAELADTDTASVLWAQTYDF